MNFGNNLKRLLDEKYIPVRFLAKDICVSESAVYGWLAGRNTPDVYKIITIADYLGVTLDELVRGEEDE